MASLTNGFDSRQSTADQSSITSTAFTALGFVFVALRLLTRGVIVRNVGREDYTIVLAWLLSLGLTVCIWMEVNNGQGHHVATLTPDNLTNVFHWLWISLPFYQGGLSLVKFSILLQYYRIFPTRSMRRAIYVLGTVCVAYFLFSMFDNIFMCTPVAYFWNKTIPGGHCLSSTVIWFTNAGINIATDVAIFLLPLPAMQKLQLPRAQKVGLMVVFALGGFVCLTSVLRLKSLYDITKSTDPTFDNGPIAYWSSVELNVGIVCASLPPLRALATRFFPRLFSGASGRGYSNTSRYGKKTRTGPISAHANGTIDPQRTITEIEGVIPRPISPDGAEKGLMDLNKIQVVTIVEQDREEVE